MHAARPEGPARMPSYRSPQARAAIRRSGNGLPGASRPRFRLLSIA